MDSNIGTTLPLLDQSWLKLRRAKEHFYSLNAAINVFWDSKPNAVVHEYDTEKSKNLFRFKVLRDVPYESWGMVIGDLVHNARSALDYLAWRLAGSDIEDIRTQFPICLTAKKFDDVRWRLKLIHPDAFAEISKLQPYTRPNPKEHALWFLQELDARDKHKLITVTKHITNAARYSASLPYATTIPMSGIGKIEADAPLIEITGPCDPDMDVTIHLASTVLFEQGIISEADDYEALPCLGQVCDVVEGVLLVFDRLLRAHPDWIRNA